MSSLMDQIVVKWTRDVNFGVFASYLAVGAMGSLFQESHGRCTLITSHSISQADYHFSRLSRPSKVEP